jgi:hypothetical protein
MTLFVITSLSDLMINRLLFEHSRGDIIVVTPRQDVADLLAQFGIDAFLLATDIHSDIEGRDRQFKELAMPGVFSDTAFDTSDLPVWQVLSIDRLKFWYTPESEIFLGFIDNLKWDKAYISLDIGSVLPISVMNLAKERGAYSYAVKTEPIKTIEILDMIPFLTFDEYLVDTKEDARFLENAGGEVSVTEEKEQKHTEFLSKEKLRDVLGIQENVTLSGILFDKRDERQARTLLKIIDNQDKQIVVVFIFPVDERSAELAPSSLQEYINTIYIQTDPKMMAACDELVCTRWDDNYCLNLPFDPIIFDVHGINKAELIAPSHIEVQGLPTL